MKNAILMAAQTALAAALAAVPVSVTASEYTIDSDTSVLAVRLFKAGLASAFAHDHVIHAADIEGRVTWDPSDPGGARVDIEVDARSLVVDDPSMRARYEVGDALDDDTRADIRETMESEKQLDVDRFPRMAFTAVEVSSTTDGTVEVTGELELHGQSRAVTFTTSPVVDGDTLRAAAEIRFLQSDHGIKPYSGMLGTVRNRDEAVLLVDLVAHVVVAGDDDADPGTDGDHD